MSSVSSEFVWKIPPSKSLGRNMAEYRKNLVEAIHEVLQEFSARAESWMKEFAPWTDRTSNARQGLSGRVERSVTKMAMILGHKMEYGIYLETSHGGKWGIVAKTIETFFPRIMAVIRGIMA